MSILKTPKWQRELKSFLGVKNGIILEGNVLDEHPIFWNENEVDFWDLDRVIGEFGRDANGEVIYYDPINGFYCHKDTEEEEKELLDAYLTEYDITISQNAGPNNASMYMPIKKKNCGDAEVSKQVLMSEIVKKALLNEEKRKPDENGNIVYPWKIVVLNFASRLEQCNSIESYTTEMFLNIEQAVVRAKHSNGRRNTVVMVVDKSYDIPSWVYKSNPYMRSIMIETPDRNLRQQFLRWIASRPMYRDKFYPFTNDDSKQRTDLAAQTEGLQCREIEQIVQISQNEGFGADDIGKALKLYKYGIEDSPWENLEDNIIEHVHEVLTDRVKGQDNALNKVENVIMRAVKGMSGLQHSNAQNKPRGVLFFAGPTGVGKTETAKAIAESIFGDEEACIRFDMSEYRLEQSDQKLFGAPPGYVGYDEGGQLTNAIKNHPFSVLLFDEIEKAHPTIMDKFLQILEDGRMTDNQGNTVYFSESIIVFTSNIGLTETEYDELGRPRLDGTGNVIRKPTICIKDVHEKDSEEFQNEVTERLINGVKNYFINNGRPELLNRLGENNIVVFQFIDRDVATMICNHQLKKITKSIKEQHEILVNYDAVLPYLNNLAIESRPNGGRGIGNMLEEKFINPLAEYICSEKTIPTEIECKEENGSICFVRKEA